MKAYLCALALVPFVSLAAVAQAAPPVAPTPLSDSQMDTVSAGWKLLEVDVSNTSWTRVGIWTPVAACGTCYLNLTSQAFNVQSHFGPVI